RLRSDRRVHAADVISRVLGRLLRRQSFRHEGRLAGHRARPCASGFPQLVPSTLSLCLCRFPVRKEHVTAPSEFAEELAETLRRQPRQIPSKYLYDELGSALFEAICRLPWYRITRAEASMLVRHARDILRPLRRPVTLAELGGGSGE